MHFHGLSGRLLGSPARARVLAAVLAAPDTDYTGREVARMAGVSPARALDALYVLEAEGVCWRRIVGRASLWRVDRRHFLARHLAPVGTLETEAMRALTDLLLLHLRRSGAQEAYLFGSLARGDERATSDIDLVAVFAEGGARRRWERGLPELQNLVQQSFGNELQAIAYTRAAISRGGPRRVWSRAKAEGRAIEGLS